MADEFITIPCLSDNYAYLIRTGGGAVILVDAPEPGPIQAALAENGWTLTHILLTHHHADHIDGVAALRAGTEVIGAARDSHRLPPLDRQVAPGDSLEIGGLRIDVLEASGHTVGHVAFHAPALPALFSADSLMVMGCGRLFEGDAAMMWEAMAPDAGTAGRHLGLLGP